MIEKEYYRLSELYKRYDVSEEEVRYWLEQELIPLHFYRTESSYVIRAWKRNVGFVGLARVAYKGLVSLPSDGYKSLLDQKRFECARIQLLQKENATLISVDYPFSVELPNELFEKWIPTDPGKVTWEMFPALEHPREEPTFASNAKSFFEMVHGAMGAELALTDKYQDLKQSQLSLPTYSYKLEELCFTVDTLQTLGVVNSSSSTDSHPVDVTTTNTKHGMSFKDVLDELLFDIQSHKRLEAKQVFRLLEKESLLDRDERIFDKRGIIVDVSDTVILWRDHLGKNTRETTFGTLRNRLTEVKKQL